MQIKETKYSFGLVPQKEQNNSTGDHNCTKNAGNNDWHASFYAKKSDTENRIN